MQEKLRQKKIPQRRCVGCNESKNKTDLIRIVRAPTGEISADFTGKRAGRGAYLCKSVACLQRAKKAKRLESHLECAIPDSVYLLLEEELHGSDHSI